MSIHNQLVIQLAKLVSLLSRLFNLGAGATWPGEIALMLNPEIVSSLALQLKKGIIIVAGTNGKTTTSLMIRQILEAAGFSVVHNASGANLLNGIVSSLIQKPQADWGVFEVDENVLPQMLNAKCQMLNKRFFIVLLNLFRDQLDRYGEVDVIAEKWEKALDAQNKQYRIIANADDPLIAYIASKLNNVSYFGLNDPKLFQKKEEHAMDSAFCPHCGQRLHYTGRYFSHLGLWNCPKCNFIRPKVKTLNYRSALTGIYNQYNTLAATTVAKQLKIKENLIRKSLNEFQPAFGRQEEFVVKGRKIKIFLSKNPAGFNASLRTVLEVKPKTILLVLNDRIPDGRDISWIWDVDFEMIEAKTEIIVCGDRVYDLALRLKYAGRETVIIPNVKQAITEAKDDLYILATYSAMLEVRKILLGRKIL